MKRLGRLVGVSQASTNQTLAVLRGGAVWDAAAVRKSAQAWERKPGRPRARAGTG